MIKPLFHFAAYTAIVAFYVAWDSVAFGHYGTVLKVAIAWWVGCVVAMIGMLRQASRKPDPLREAGVVAWERHGFCFGMGIAEVFGTPCLILIYQNRYERPCVADIALRPTDSTAGHGFKVIQLAVRCDGGGDGHELVFVSDPNNIPNKLARFEIAADVHYPEGRGRLLRWQKGTPVSSLQSLHRKADADLVTVSIPMVDITQPEGTPTPSPTTEAAIPNGSAPPSPAPTSEEPPVGTTTLSEPDLGVAWAPLPGKEDFTADRLCELLAHFRKDGARASQLRFIRNTKLRAAAPRLGLAAACLLGGGWLVVSGVRGLLQPNIYTGSVLFVVVGAMAATLGRALLPWWWFQDGTSAPRAFATTPEEALKGLLALTLGPKFDRQIWWTVAAKFVAYPAVALFRDEPEAAEALTRRWEGLRETLLASTTAVEVGCVQTSPQLALGEGVAMMSVELRAGRATVVLRNAALRLCDHWFLVTLEPHSNEPEREQCVDPSAATAKPAAPVAKLNPGCKVHAVPVAPVRTSRHRQGATYPLGETIGWERDFDRERVHLCSLDDYKRAVAALPPPTDEQIENYVEYVCGAHSWYKKLPLLPPGFPFVFYFDPGAGYRCVLQAGGRVRMEEILPDDSRSHYNQRTTAFYHENFGRLRYDTFWSWPAVAAMENSPDPMELSVFSADRTAYRVPWEALKVSLVGVTSAVSPRGRCPLDCQRKLAPEGFQPDPNDTSSWRRLRELARANEHNILFGWNDPEWQQLMEGERSRVRAEMAQAIRRLRGLVYPG